MRVTHRGVQVLFLIYGVGTLACGGTVQSGNDPGPSADGGSGGDSGGQLGSAGAQEPGSSGGHAGASAGGINQGGQVGGMPAGGSGGSDEPNGGSAGQEPVGGMAGSTMGGTGGGSAAGGSGGSQVDPPPGNLSPGGRAKQRVLAFLKDSVGKRLLTGMHNYSGLRNETDGVRNVTGKFPAVFGTDWAYGSNATPQKWQKIVDHSIAEWNKGALITIMWHMVKPGQPNSCGWSCVKMSKTPAQLMEMATPGTALNRAYNERLDEVVGYFKQLRDAGVPVIWRPFHENNLKSFWWTRVGHKEIWMYMYKRYTEVHKLDNLIWNWNFDRLSYYPDPTPWFADPKTVEMISVDDYSADSNASKALSMPQADDYALMKRLAPGIPAGLGEVPRPPSAAFVRDNRPEIVYWLNWPRSDDRVRVTDQELRTIFNHPYSITRDEMPNLRQ